MQAQASSSKISKKEMRDATQRSGYLLEQRVEPILSKEGYFVQMNAAYLDPDTRKTREIDISAITARKVYKEEFIFPVLLCECKNNPHPVVFFTKTSPISFLHHEEVKMSGIPVKMWDKGGYISLSEFTKMEDYHHYCKGEVATQYCSFQLKKGQPPEWMASHEEEQHDIFNSLIKVLEYEINSYYSRFTLPRKGQAEAVNVQIYYPLVILQGNIYSAHLSKGKLSLKKAKHIQFRKESFLPLSNEIDTYQFDIITEKYLPDYLKIIDSEMEKIIQVFKRKRKQVSFSIDKIIAEAGKGKKKEKSYRKYFDF